LEHDNRAGRLDATAGLNCAAGIAIVECNDPLFEMA